MDWANLPADVLGRILARLPCVADRAAFVAVCTKWRTVGAQHPLPPQLPWVLVESAPEKAFCITCGDMHRVFLAGDVCAPAAVGTSRRSGSQPGGWVPLTLHHQREDGGGLSTTKFSPSIWFHPHYLATSKKFRVDRIREMEQHIDQLIQYGIELEDVRKLQVLGVFTCNVLLRLPKKSLIDTGFLPEGTVNKIYIEAERLVIHEWMSSAYARSINPFSGRVLQQAKKFTALAWRQTKMVVTKAMKKRHALVAQAPHAAEVVGRVADQFTTFPVTPSLRAGAEYLRHLNEAIDMANAALKTYKSWTETPAEDYYHVVGTVEEALTVIEKWKKSGKPLMKVEPYFRLTEQEKTIIVDVFMRNQATDILDGFEWFMV